MSAVSSPSLVQRNWPYFAGLAVVVVAVAAIALATHAVNPPPSLPVPGVAVDVPAPSFSLPDVSGDKMTLESMRGRVVLVNFWATWCGPCRDEMPRLQQVASDIQGKPFTVLEIDFQEDTITVRDFEQGLGLHLTTLLDEDGAVSRVYGVRALPATFLVDARGVLREKRLGPLLPDGDASTPWSVPWVRRRMSTLLDAPAQSPNAG